MVLPPNELRTSRDLLRRIGIEINLHIELGVRDERERGGFFDSIKLGVRDETERGGLRSVQYRLRGEVQRRRHGRKRDVKERERPCELGPAFEGIYSGVEGHTHVYDLF